MKRFLAKRWNEEALQAVLSVGVAVAFAASASASIVGDVTYLGPGVDARDIDNGQIVGTLSVSTSPHAFSWTEAGGMRDPGTLGGMVSFAFGVSNGEVVGFAQLGDTPDGCELSRFLWTESDGMRELGTSEERRIKVYSAAYDIERSGSRMVEPE
jgi:probable HAF family extracellular repeat protein